MSHLPVRKEAVCLNCGNVTTDRFCARCGQENIEPKESVFHFISHFVNDIVHFDGKFFSTIKYLLFRPGFLSKEYVKGRRASYLDPVKMYLFTSFVFFFMFFSIFKIDNINVEGKISEGANPNTKLISVISDSTDYKNAIDGVTSFTTYDSLETIRIGNGNYSSKAEYDSLIKAGKINDSWLERKINYQQIKLNNKYANTQGKFIENLLESMIHNFPKMLFFSLPFAALILQLLYIRRKQFYYVGHGIFIIHFYIFIFLMILLGYGIAELLMLIHIGSFLPSLIIFLLIFFYLYKSMKFFYGQSRKITILKWIIFNFSFLMLFILLSILLFFLSFMQV
ncbi:MAG: DUF3667 domain-containing protein [Ferruginibacter sp.]